jgi:hypothetical protein
LVVLASLGQATEHRGVFDEGFVHQQNCGKEFCGHCRLNSCDMDGCIPLR